MERRMTSFAARGLRWIVLRTAGKEAVRRFIVRTAALFGIDLVVAAYNSIGILNYETSEASGEDHLMRDLLPRMIRSASPVLFDVGANRGEMSISLRREFPSARIVAFEPNPVTYAQLIAGVDEANVECINAGLGATESTGVLHCYRGDQTSGHATMYREMFQLYEGYGVEAASDLTTFEFPIRTLDATTASLGIDRIHFLKIDVEGHELQVLKGAGALLARNAIDIIQFEFTDCNVLSRTFLRDFYELLTGFTFHRLGTRELIPLGPYAARHEIFQYQNILAVRSGIDV
jgi:FkbM family methyltransferase